MKHITCINTPSLN